MKRIIGLSTGVAAGLVVAGLAWAHDPGNGCTDVHERDTVTIVCGDGDNEFSGTDERDVIFTHGGRDSGSGGRIGDVIRGGAGNDRLKGGRGNDEVYGASGDDTINGGDGSDVIEDGGDQHPLDRDILCAGADDVRDVVDALDQDAADVLYVDRNEEDAWRIDSFYANGAIHYDVLRPSSECPMNE
jgi:Ca2+-binding RTX toxin-like protein